MVILKKKLKKERNFKMHQVEKIRKKGVHKYDPYEEFRIPGPKKPGKVLDSLKDYKRNRKNVRQILEDLEEEE